MITPHYVCDFANGELTATYGTATEDGIIPITELEGDGDPKMFAPRPEDQLPEDEVAESDSVPYAGAEGVCGLSGVEVACGWDRPDSTGGAVFIQRWWRGGGGCP